jgi:hypothetical protein
MTHTASVEQIVGDVKAAIKSMGRHGKVVLVVVAPDDDGTILHHVERSRMTGDDWDRLMRTAPETFRKGKNEGRR